MPFVHTVISTPLNGQQRASLAEVYCAVCKNVLGKPDGTVMAAFTDNTPIEFQGSAEPAAYVRVEVWSEYDPSKPKEMTPSITAAITKESGIPADRVYVTYYSTYHWGYKGANV